GRRGRRDQRRPGVVGDRRPAGAAGFGERPGRGRGAVRTAGERGEPRPAARVGQIEEREADVGAILGERRGRARAHVVDRRIGARPELVQRLQPHRAECLVRNHLRKIGTTEVGSILYPTTGRTRRFRRRFSGPVTFFWARGPAGGSPFEMFRMIPAKNIETTSDVPPKLTNGKVNPFAGSA